MISVSLPEISARLRKLQLSEFDLIIGIGTGGIVPASIIAFHLECELLIITFNYRDTDNKPLYDNPVLLHKPDLEQIKNNKILLVDDVSVSGKTLNEALKYFDGCDIKTLTMKGKADYVLFPEIKDCVKWPWK